MSKQDKPEETSAPIAPKQKAKIKRVFSGTQEHMVDLFKLQLAVMKHQEGWTEKPSILDVEHVHFFRTKDRYGKDLQFATSTGGHTHEVTWGTDEHGNLVAECGPAIRKVLVNVGEKDNARYEEQTMPVRHKRKGMKALEDNHTHEIIYLRTDVMSAQSIAQAQAKDKDKLMRMAANQPKAVKAGEITTGDAENSD
ncbi:MAG: hypothetical protein E6R04_10710 [Spirochaetes bacterium]|nr:MAG: hypothetical protein E6R04_10710 [Spirochaetota bacterium]